MVKKRERKLWNRLSTLTTLLNHHIPPLDSHSISPAINSKIPLYRERRKEECEPAHSNLLASQPITISQGRDNYKRFPIDYVKRSSNIFESNSMKVSRQAKDLLDLPCELISQVLDFCLTNSTSSRDPFSYTETLRSLRLVCRQFSGLLERHVFESLRITNIEMLREILEFFNSSKKLHQLKLVKRLCISPNDLTSNQSILSSERVWEMLKMMSWLGLSEIEIHHLTITSSSSSNSKRFHSILPNSINSHHFILNYTSLQSSLSSDSPLTHSQQDHFHLNFNQAPPPPPHQIQKSLFLINPSFRALDVTDTASVDVVLNSYTFSTHHLHLHHLPELQVLRIRSSKPIFRRFWHRPMLRSLKILILDKRTARVTHWDSNQKIPSYEFDSLPNLKLLIITGLLQTDQVHQTYFDWRESYGLKVIKAPEDDHQFSLKQIMIEYLSRV
ncbi:hypothetical protein DFH28DRAFT_928419 [Melampsora americana]|nr:hypothetical protein DFH28DRAFT_928419 [Melampsora americana]